MLMTMHSVRCVRSMDDLSMDERTLCIMCLMCRCTCPTFCTGLVVFSDCSATACTDDPAIHNYCTVYFNHTIIIWTERKKENASLRTSELPPMSIQARRSLHFIYACIRQIILLASSVFSYLRVIWLRFCVRWSCYSLHLHLDCSQLLPWPQMAWAIDRMEYCLKLSWASDSNQLDLTSIARRLFIQCKPYIGNRLTCK